MRSVIRCWGDSLFPRRATWKKIRILMVVAAILTGGASGARAASVLEQTAASMQSGTWVDITASVGGNAAIGTLLESPTSPGSHINEYADKGMWNPITREALFVGACHGNPAPGDGEKFIRFSDATNLWNIAGPDVSPATYQAHSYQHNAIDLATGDIYYRRYDSTEFYRFRNGAWMSMPSIPMPSRQVAGALEGFSERNGILFIDGDWGVYWYNITTNAWTVLAETNGNWGSTMPKFPMGPYHNVAVYNPIHKIILFGGGNGSAALYRMTQSGALSIETTAPVSVAVNSTVFTVDPATGDYLLFDNSSRFWKYSPATKIWTQMPTSQNPPFFTTSVDGPALGTVAFPISTYGVVMFTTWSHANSKVYLYKHAPSVPDAQSPAAPSGLTASVASSTQINLSWTVATDNIGVAGYRLYRGGVQVGTSAATSYADTGLQASTGYTYAVAAYDGAGNLSAQSGSVSATTLLAAPAADTTPPVVLVTAPTGSSTVSGVIDVTAGATDNVAVAGVQFKFDGVNIGSEDIAAPYTLAVNTLTTTNGTHTFTAVARDAAGNSTTSAVITVTVNNTVSPPGTPALAQLAASMQPQEWREIVTTNMNATLLANGNSGVSTVYTDDMVWHAASQTAFFFGSDHNDFSQFVSYTAGNNTWQRLARAAWMPDPGDYNNGMMHGYDHSAINQSGNFYYHRPFGVNLVHRYNIQTQVWTTLPNPSFPNNYGSCCDALEYFPELNGLVWVRSIGGEVWLFNDGTQQWSLLGAVGDGSTWQQAEYNPVHKVMVFTVGGRHYKLSSTGQITPLAAPPVGLYNGSGYNGVLTVDPVSGDYLTLTPDSRNFYRYNVLNDSWQALSQPSKPNMSGWGVIATPVNTYGVTMFAACRVGDCKAYLYKHANSGPADTTIPTVVLTSPANNANVSGTAVAVSASASDNVSVAGVQFKFDGVNIGSEDTTAPYGITLNTTTTTNGVHVLTAVARDAAGNSATSAGVTVNVNNAASDATAPSAPSGMIAGVVSSSQINVSWTASNDNVGVTGYRLERCTGSGCTNFVQIAAPTGLSHNDTGLTASTLYRYRTRAADAAGNLSAYSTIASNTTNTMQNGPAPDTTAPVVLVSAPTNGSTVSGTINVTAGATDNVAVAGVQFKFDDVNIGSEDTTAPYSINLNTTTTTNGAHVLTAIARDAASNTATSAAVTITVNNTTPPPGSSVLAQTAASMQPGEWKQLTTNGFNNGGILEVSCAPSNVVEYADSGTWDPISKQFLFYGASHGSCYGQKLLIYRESDNSWGTGPLYPGSCSGNNGCFEHAYHQNTMNPATGDLFYRPYGSNSIHKYATNGNQQWSTTTAQVPNGTSNCCGAIEYFPEMGGIVWINGPFKSLHLLNSSTGQWSTLATNLAIGGYDNVIEYSPVHHVMLIGGGRNAGRVLYKLDASGQVTRLADAPTDVLAGSIYSLSSIDPVSGNLLGFSPEGNYYEYNVATNAWRQIAGQHPLKDAYGEYFELAEASLTTHGVSMFVKHAPAAVWLYKHSMGALDTVAPAVALTSPANNANVSGAAVSVSANATDNVGVAGVQFKFDGVNVDSEDTAAPYGIMLNTTTASNGAHVLTAVARDASGNSTISMAITVNVNNTAPPPTTGGLVAAYSFDAGSGTALADLSGNNHPGTLVNSPAWAAGKYGNALSFDGVNDYVTIGDLDLTGPFTISMWALADNLGGGCHGSAVMKRYDYGFEVCNGQMYGQIGNGSGPGWTASTAYTVPQAGVWNHYALTYDGTTARLYVNGTQSQTAAGAHTANNDNLMIGAWTTSSEFYDGLIDEVRIYSRALAQAEIQSDMNTPVGNAGPAALTITAPAAGAVVTGSTLNVSYTKSGDLTGSAVDHVHLQLDANAEIRDLDFDGSYQFTDVPVGAHTLNGYLAKADHSKVAGTDVTVTFTTQAAPAPDTAAPTVSLTAPANNATISGVVVSVTANASDNIGVAGVQFKFDGVNIGSEDTTAPYGVALNTTTATNGAHVLTAVARDAAGNTATSAGITVNVDNTTPPASGHINGYPMPSLQDEKTTYSGWGWTWNTSQEPNFASDASYTVSDPDIHGDTEGDDLWAYLMMYQRTGQRGYLDRATAWANYFKNSYRNCVGDQYHNYCYDRDAFGLDHAYGAGLIAWYQYTCAAGTCDTAALTTVELIAGDLEALYDPNSGFTCYARDACTGWGYRAVGRQLLLVTRLAEVTGNSRWIQFRDKILNLVMTTSNWDAVRGMYFYGGAGTDDYLQPGAHAAGSRIVSPFEIGVFVEGMAQAYRTTGRTDIRDRIVAMARFVDQNGLDPAYQYAGSRFGIVNGQLWHNYSSSTPVTFWDPVYTTSLVNLLAYGAKFSGDPQLLVRAQHFFNRGTKGVYGSPTQRAAADNIVHHFVDTVFDSSYGNFYLAYNKGELLYTYQLFDRSGTTSDTVAPTIALTAPANNASVSGAAVSVTANATDNVGVAGVQFKFDGVNLGSEDTTAPYGITLNTTTTTNGAHVLTAVVRDAAGNSATSAGVTINVNNAVADTTVPSTPSGLTAGVVLSTQINLSWTASTDNVGVTGYRLERCTGSGCTNFVQIATPAGLSHNDTGLTASTFYNYRIRAVDTAGNLSAYSIVASGTTQTASPPAGGNDFQARCSGSGVTRCYDFDNAVDIAPRIFAPSGGSTRCTNNQCWIADTSVKASGSSSLRFELPAQSGADTSGSFWLNFADNFSQQFGVGEQFYVQWRQRFSPEMLTAFKRTDGSQTGWKQIIVGEGDQTGQPTAYSCTELELVFQQDSRYMGPSFYHSCGRWASLDYWDGTQVRMQHQGPPNCYYPNDPLGGCFRYAANEWMTFKMRVQIGQWNTASSRIQVWSAREGQQSVMIYDTINSHSSGFTLFNNPGSGSGTNPGAKYGKLWLLPYTTARDSNATYQQAFTWYDELIISRSDIADPGAAGTSDTTIPTVALTAPANNATVSGAAVSVSASASDNVGVAGVQFKFDGVNVGSEDTTTPYGITLNTTTTSNDAHVLTAVARDAAGNSTTSAAVTVNVNNAVADTTVPSTPSGMIAGVVSSSQINVSWTASTDNIGVTGYRLERCTGSGCTNFAQIATPTGLSHNDTGLTASTLYRYRARAADAAGNLSAYSTSASATTAAGNALPAFPGAEGFGINTLGGRGGPVLVVTNLNPSGPGSFREAMLTSGPRIIVFRVSGVIDLGGDISLTETHSNATVLGQSSPGGITFINGAIGNYHTNVHDFIFRFIRIRAQAGDTIAFNPVYNLVIDHSDFSGGADETFDIDASHDITVQWSTILNSMSGSSSQNYGALIAYRPTNNMTFHHNFNAHHLGRCGAQFHWSGSEPVPADGVKIDLRNNIFYNCGFQQIYRADLPPAEGTNFNLIGNYAKSGPNTPSGSMLFGLGGTIYMNDNLYPGQSIMSIYTNPTYLSQPHPFPAITTTSALQAYDDVLQWAGSWPRDAMTTRTVNEAKNGTGTLGKLNDPLNTATGPAPLPDSDLDGIPDSWESSHGLNPNDGQDSRRIHSSGYANIEVYLNEVAQQITGQTPPSTDTTAPTVALTAPANNATVSGASVAVSATASDNVGVAGVQFKIDGVNLGAEDTTAPYAVTLDTTTATNGTHVLTAVARDAAGNSATSVGVNVTVNNAVSDTTAPVASVSAPAAGATVSGTMNFAAMASDNVGVARVEFYVDGALKSTDTASPYAYAWDTTNGGTHPCSGAHTHALSVKAYDTANNVGISANVVVNMSNPPYCTTPDTVAPTVAITAPASNATVSGAAVAVAATASDNVGVAGVQFKIDGFNLGQEDITAPYAVTFDSSAFTNGAHVLTATARDAAGNTTTSSVMFTVTASGAGGNAIDTLTPLTWYEVPNSKSSSTMYQYPAGYYFGNTTNVRFLDESGASYDSLRNRMIVWGGGHQDYAGNEIMTFDIDTLRWIRINDPSPRFDTSGSIENSGYYPDESGNPDLQQPRSRHSYWYPVYIPSIDRYCSVGASFTFPNARSSGHVDCFNFSNNRWEQKRDAVVFNGLASSTYDPATQHVWTHGMPWDSTMGRLAEWNPATDVWTIRSAGPSGIKDRSAPALDTRRHRLVYLGAGELRYFDLNLSGTLTPQLVTMTGDTEILSKERIGFAYDSVNDKLVAWSGRTSSPAYVFVIDPATWVSERVTLGGTPPRAGDPNAVNGTYGRFAYIPTKNAFILINDDINDNVFFFKLSSAAGIPPSGDGSPPAVSLTAPANNATVSGSSVTVSANAADNIGVAGVQFKFDGMNIGNEDTNAPYGITLNTTTTTNGAHVLTAVARDAAGNTTTSAAVTINVSNAAADTTAPSAPSGLIAGVVSSVQINLSWTASTDNIGVTGYRLERCQGSGCTNFVQIAAPAGLSHNDTGLTASTLYRYRVRAADAAGNLSSYSTIASNTTQAADTSAPSVLISAPMGGSTVSGAVNVIASASDNVGVAGVQFKFDGMNVGAEDTIAPYGISLNTTTTINGTHILTATARDAAGNTATSAAVTININNTVTSDAVEPSVPQGLIARVLSSSRINVIWTASTDNVGVTGYQLERCEGPGCQNYALIATTAGTSHDDTGLAANTRYRYRVRAVDAAGNLSHYSSPASNMTLAASSTNMRIMTNATRAGVPAPSLAATAQSAVPPPVMTNTARTATGKPSTGSTTPAVTAESPVAPPDLPPADNIAPSKPKSPRASAQSHTRIDLSWGAAADDAGVAGYRVHRGDTLLGSTEGTAYTATGLNPATIYKFSIAAFDAAGNVSVPASVSAKTKPAPNHAPVLAAIAPHTIAAGETLTIQLAASDPDGDTLRYTARGKLRNATLDRASGLFTWTPRKTQAGRHVMIFKASDGKASDTRSLTITVTR